MKTLVLNKSFIILKLSDLQQSNTILDDQLEPYLNVSPNLVLDLENVNFNSMMIGELMNVYNKFAEHWRDYMHKVVIIHATENTHKAFESVKLTEKIQFFPNFEEASKSE